MKQSKISYVFHWALITYSNNTPRWITQFPGFFMPLLQSHFSHHPTAETRKSRAFPQHWELFLTHTFKHHHLPSLLVLLIGLPLSLVLLFTVGWKSRWRGPLHVHAMDQPVEVQQNISTSSFISISTGNTVPNLSHQHHNMTLQVVLLIFTPSSDLVVVLCIITIIRKS